MSFRYQPNGDPDFTGMSREEAVSAVHNDMLERLCERLGSTADAYERGEIASVRLTGKSDDECRDLLFSPSLVRASASQKKGGQPEDARRGSVMSNVARMQTASEWLADQIAISKDHVRSMAVDLTVELARALLAQNPGNRKLSINAVDKYARDMAGGSWAFNGEPVIVSRDGFLNDGQHRCEAVIAAAVAIPVVLVFGTSRDSRLTIDQGRNRMTGDYLAMEGHTDGLALAAAAGFLWQYEQHGRLSQQTLYRPTKAEVMAVVADTPKLEQSLQIIPKKGADAVGGRAILAFAHFLFAKRAGAAVANEFMDMLVTGINLAANSPILYARNRLTANRGRLKPNEKAELILRAWGAWRRRETPKTLVVNNDALPMVER